MIALRQTQELKDGRLILDIAVGFASKKVEVIVLPAEDTPATGNNLSDILLSAPVASPKDLLVFRQNRRRMEKWKLKKF